MSDAKILLLDIETAPNTGYFWGLWEQNISPSQVKQTSYILCWSAKWLHGERFFASAQKTPMRDMLAQAHELLNEADVVVHYNGRKFDIPTLNKEFIKNKFRPPSPYRQVDLYKYVKSEFRFESNKMDSICRELDLSEKVKHAGFELWVGCMEGDAKSWRTMERYNRRDIVMLDELYAELLPWIPNHPHVGLISGKTDACPACGVVGKLVKQGQRASSTKLYQQYQCRSCGRWSRSRLAEKGLMPSYV